MCNFAVADASSSCPCTSIGEVTTCVDCPDEARRNASFADLITTVSVSDLVREHQRTTTDYAISASGGAEFANCSLVDRTRWAAPQSCVKA